MRCTSTPATPGSRPPCRTRRTSWPWRRWCSRTGATRTRPSEPCCTTRRRTPAAMAAWSARWTRSRPSPATAIRLPAMPGLSDDEIRQALQDLPGWRHERGEIFKQYKFPTFLEAIAFIDRLAEAADELNHHPDLENHYN